MYPESLPLSKLSIYNAITEALKFNEICEKTFDSEIFP